MNIEHPEPPGKQDGTGVPKTPAAWSSNDSLKIFLSHRSADKGFASEIKHIFESFDEDRVGVFISPNVENAGSDYRKAIRSHLINSDCVVLLYTDEAERWDWPLYECGYFHGRHQEAFDGVDPLEPGLGYKGRRLFIIHSDGVQRPRPVENWDSIAVSTADFGDEISEPLTPLLGFLQQLFFEQSFQLSQPILQAIGQPRISNLKTLRKPFLHAMQGDAKSPRSIPPTIYLEIPRNATWPESGGLPDCTVLRCDDVGLKVLGIGNEIIDNNQANWTKVLPVLRDHGGDAWDYWIIALADTIRDLQKGVDVPSALPLLRVNNSTESLRRPILSETWRKRDGTSVFTILLANVANELDRMPHDEFGSLTRLLWMTRMFTYGIVEKYGKKFNHLVGNSLTSDAEWQKFYSGFVRAVHAVYAEAFNAGYDREKVKASLTGDDLTEYETQIEKWKECTEHIKSLNAITDAEQRKRIYLILFQSMSEVARATYLLATRCLADAASKIKIGVGDQSGNGRTTARPKKGGNGAKAPRSANETALGSVPRPRVRKQDKPNYKKR